MTAFKETVRSAFGEYLDALRRTVEGLTPAEARWQPTLQANHIAWIVWHMARVEDVYINRMLRGTDEVWRAGGWASRFGMDPESAGAGQTIDQVRAMPDIAVADLMAYYDAVRETMQEYLDRAEEADLVREYRHPKRGSVKGTWLLGHLLVEECQHVGQAAYIKGMIQRSV